VRIDEIMPEADIIVTEAGFGTTAAALEQRKKIVLLPRTAEQWLLAVRLAEQGLARWLDSETVPYGLTDLIAEVINDRDRPPALSMQVSREQPVESVVSALLSCFNAGDSRLLRNK
jgi:UDP:flavonoid glycosyltransferase YjiC (YdhE family)